MSDDYNDMKASIIFMCAVHENPVVEIEKLSSVKIRGMFLPALSCVAILEQGTTYPVKFPVAALEALNEQQFEELRKNFHERIDKTFDEYKANWPKMQDNKRQRASKNLTSLKKKETSDLSEPKSDDNSEN